MPEIGSFEKIVYDRLFNFKDKIYDKVANKQ